MNEDKRIADKAYQIWVSEGCPPDRADANWEAARELVAHADKQMLATKPIGPPEGAAPTADGTPVEPLLAVQNQGEFPTLTDQGEEQSYPDPALAAADTDDAPVGTVDATVEAVRGQQSTGNHADQIGSPREPYGADDFGGTRTGAGNVEPSRGGRRR